MRNKIALIGLITISSMAQENTKPELKFGGDLRARGEWLYQDYTDAKASNYPNTERYSQVLRARLSATATQGVWTAGMRIVTGCGLPTSSNTTEGNALTGNDFQSKPIYLDRAFLNLKWIGGEAKDPDWRFQVQFGKFANPLVKGFGGSSELIYGNDVGPEGAHVGMDFGNNKMRLSANTGRFWVDEITLDRPGKGDKPDIFLQAQQVILDLNTDEIKVRLGGGSHYYNDLLGKITLGDSTNSYGNITENRNSSPTDKVKKYTTNFNLVEGFADISFGGKLPIMVSGSYVKNLEDDSSSTNQGFLAGIKIGSAKKKDQMEISYAFRRAGANSSVGYTSSPDFGGYKTNSMGSIISLKYLLTDNLSADLIWHAFNKIGIRDSDKEETLNRARIELNANF